MNGGRSGLRYLLTTITLAGGCGAQPEDDVIDALSEADRESFFLEAIRDGGFICARVMTTQRITDDGMSWRVSCTDPAAYLLTVERGTVTEVSPTPYTEPLPSLRQPTVPSPRQRPD